MIETGIKAKKAAQSASLLSTELKNKVLKDLKIKLLQGELPRPKERSFLETPAIAGY